MTTPNPDECFACGTRIACKDSYGHVLLPGLEHCSSECTHRTLRAFNMCIGCDGENTATGNDGWCDECRNIAQVEGIPAVVLADGFMPGRVA